MAPKSKYAADIFTQCLVIIFLMANLYCIKAEDPCSELSNFEKKVQVGDRCLFIPAESVNWVAARHGCRVLGGGSLLVIDSRKKQELVTAALRPIVDRNRDMWIGGEQKPSKWTWTQDGESLSRYLGCCSPSLLHNMKTKENVYNNAPASCIKLCRRWGYTQAYLRDIECRCQNGSCLSVVPDKICGLPCPGYEMETCGNNTSAVYSSYSSQDQSVPEWEGDHPFYPTMSSVGMSCGSLLVVESHTGGKRVGIADQYCHFAAKAICEVRADSTNLCDRQLSTSACLRLIDQPKTWFEARLSCVTNGGDLAKIRKNYLNLSSLEAHEHYWIGLSRLNGKWHTGEDILFRNNEVSYGCLSIWVNNGSPVWATDDCAEAKKQFICEKRNPWNTIETTTTRITENTEITSASTPSTDAFVNVTVFVNVDEQTEESEHMGLVVGLLVVALLLIIIVVTVLAICWMRLRRKRDRSSNTESAQRLSLSR